MKILCLFIPGLLFGANAVYLGQSSAGANDGTSCANEKAYTYFNSAGNWSGSPTGILIGPDTTVHLCGTITGTGGTAASVFTFQGSGTSGHPVTMVWETGSALTASYFSLAISLSTQKFIILDGGVACGPGTGGNINGMTPCNGTIQNTANGTGLANSSFSTFIASSGDCTSCEVRNLNLLNNYVHTQCELGTGMCDVNAGTTENAVITFNGGGSGVSVHNNIYHDCSWCVNFQAATGNASFSYYNNYGYALAHGLALYGGTTWAGPALVHDSNFGDMSNWDTGTDDKYHADSIHVFGGNLAEVDIYSSRFSTQNQCCITGEIFLEQGTAWTSNGIWRIFNNVFLQPSGAVNGLVQPYIGTSAVFFNNTIVGPSGSATGFQPSGTNVTIENNIISSFPNLLNLNGNIGTTLIALDYQAYGNTSGFNSWVGPVDTGSFTTWLAGCSCDTHSAYAASLNLNADGSPMASASNVIGKGLNLTASCSGVLASLCSDINGVARPSSAAWDIGAFQFTIPPLGTVRGGPVKVGGPVTQN